MDERRFFTVKELAQFFKTSYSGAYRFIRKPGFPAFKVGGKILIDKNRLENEWIPNQINQKEEK